LTPGQMRDELTAIQERMKEIEQIADRQKQHRSGYCEVAFELVEASEAVDRAIVSLDDMHVGMA
jgi:hypothetical protein